MSLVVPSSLVDEVRAASLQAIADMVVDCTACPLHKEPFLAVPGVGSINADIFVCAEAPGLHESDPTQYEGRTGVPMVGPAGTLLQETLFDVGYGDFSFFATNVVKHRPPGNRDPADTEKAACVAFLRGQISLVQPRAILAVGKHAIYAIAQLAKVVPPDKLHGQRFSLDGTPVFTIYHPSYILRNPVAKDGWVTTLRGMLPELETLCRQPRP